jgi:hypothetical protein
MSDDGREAARPSSLIQSVTEDVERVTGQEVEWVSGFERSEDGWKLTLELVELRRIPETTSVLASYEATTDGDGNVTQLARKRRYVRNRTED